MSRRQFDRSFKVGIVRAVRNLRKFGSRGDIGKLLQANEITHVRLHYWEKQFDEGHFSIERAVAFSRKKQMIHG